MKILLVAGLGIGGLKLLGRVWVAIEQPVLEFVTLGIVPGTSVQLSFEQILALGVAIFAVIGLFEHRNSLKRLLRDIHLKSL